MYGTQQAEPLQDVERYISMVARKYYRAIQNPKPRAIVVHCIDPRFPQAFEEFIEEELCLDRKRDIVKKLAGGPMPLAYPTQMPSRCKWLLKQLRFDCHKFPSINRIVLMAHKNCAYYSTVPTALHRCDDPNIERNDLPSMLGLLKMVIPGKAVELYHAQLIHRDTLVEFEKVEVDQFVEIPNVDALLSKVLQPV